MASWWARSVGPGSYLAIDNMCRLVFDACLGRSADPGWRLRLLARWPRHGRAEHKDCPGAVRRRSVQVRWKAPNDGCVLTCTNSST